MKQIIRELRHHAPFSVFGAITGIFVLLFLQKLPKETSIDIFYILHPIHVFLSALVTASIYKLHACGHFNTDCIKGKCNFWFLSMVGYFGAIGIATLSDCLIPYLGEILLNMPNRGVHIGFIEKWWLVNPLAIAGVLFAYVKPRTKLPHAAHVLISTWASLFHVLMAIGTGLNTWSYVIVFVFLFFAVWIPCCLSDIVFPLLFVDNKQKS